MTVRPATAADVPALQAITRANPTAPQWTEAQFLDTLQSHPGSAVSRATFVAEAEGQAVAFAVVSALTAVFPVEAELESIAVQPAFHRQGLGRVLLDEVIAWCRATQASVLRLEVRAGNLPAIALYQRTGFQQQGIRRGYYSAPVEDAACMSINLSTSELPSPAE